jgi:hypothetical protein
MATELHPYPTDIGDGVGVLLKKVKGEDVSLPELVHAAYHVEGYCLGQLLNDQPAPMAGHTPEGGEWDRPDGMKCPPDEECKAILEKATQKSAGVEGLFDKAFLAKLLAIAIKILSESLTT